MKHLPFDSDYRQDFEVVEQRVGNCTFYPHPAQLPLLLRALNLEFYGPLPPRIARVDKRAGGFDKITLETGVDMFCMGINGARKDALRLSPLFTTDLVARVSIVQQITESDRRGPFHRFRFYAGEHFFPEIYLSGKRVAFADHVLQRFSSRMDHPVGTDLTNFIVGFFGGPVIDLPVGNGRALVVSYMNSILAFPFKESEKEFFVTTCLSMNEINSLEVEIPPRALNFHYDEFFVRPKIRNWMPTEWMANLYKCWEKKIPPTPHTVLSTQSTWPRMAPLVRDVTKRRGYGPESQIVFQDNLPSIVVLKSKGKEQMLCYDELESYKQTHPQYDWDQSFAERYKEPVPPTAQTG